VIQITHILCPVDFSDFSRRAIDHAVVLARWYSARLTLLYVHHLPVATVAPVAGLPLAPVDALVLSDQERDAWRQQLRSWVPEDASREVAIACSVVEGDVALEILAAAQSADMIVLGTHGRSRFERLLHGSVAEKVLRKARVPVLTIPRAASDATVGVPTLFHRIVAAVDFSPASLNALAYAVSLAEEADAQLTLVHVIDWSPELDLWVDPAERTASMREWTAAAQHRLRAAVPDAAREYCHVEERVAVGQPYREILRVAEEREANLIVLGAHGRGIVERMFVGSTAQHIVRQAVCPVLTVREPARKAAETSG
jgi:nucleotide-binding universal stress UspA family protein